MAQLYADENFPKKSVEELRRLGHDVVMAIEHGQANLKIPDPQVLAYATTLGRAVVTHNRRDYIRLHKHVQKHQGIVVCTKDNDFMRLAQRIHDALLANEPLVNKLLRINKPSK